MSSSAEHGVSDGCTCQMESDFQTQIVSFLETKTYFEIV